MKSKERIINHQSYEDNCNNGVSTEYKFMTINEDQRCNETLSEGVERKNYILRLLLEDVMKHPNQGVKVAYSEADSIVFKYKPEDVSSMVKTKWQVIKSGIYYAIFNGYTFFFSDIVEGDKEIHAFLRQLDVKELKVSYKEVIEDNDSSKMIKDLRVGQAETIKIIEESSSDIMKSLVKPKKGTRMTIHIENGMARSALEDKMAGMKISNDVSNNVAVNNNDLIYEEMKRLYLTMQDLDGDFGRESKRINRIEELLVKNQNEICRESRNARVDAIELLKTHCTNELQIEINLMQEENPDIELKEVYNMVTQIRHNVTDLWKEWEKELDGIKQNSYERCAKVKDYVSFYTVMSKSISILQSKRATCLIGDIQSDRETLEENLSITPRDLLKFYQNCFNMIQSGDKFKHDLKREIKSKTTLLDTKINRNYVERVHSFEEHVRDMCQEIRSTTDAKITYEGIKKGGSNRNYMERVHSFGDHVRDMSQEIRSTDDTKMMNDSCKKSSSKFIDQTKNIKKGGSKYNHQEETEAKISYDEEQEVPTKIEDVIASQDTIDKARDRASKELGTYEFQKIKQRVMQLLAPQELPSMVCYKCFCSDVIFKDCPRCKKIKVRFE